MQSRKPVQRHRGFAAPLVLAGVAGVTLLGCGSIAKVDRDLEDHPITDTGVAATIMMPGQGIPGAQPAVVSDLLAVDANR